MPLICTLATAATDGHFVGRERDLSRGYLVDLEGALLFKEENSRRVSRGQRFFNRRVQIRNQIIMRKSIMVHKLIDFTLEDEEVYVFVTYVCRVGEIRSSRSL